MDDAVRNINLLGIRDLERLVAGFPWYTHARQILLYKLAQTSEECLEQKFREYAAFLHSRELVYYKTRDILSGKLHVDIEETDQIDESVFFSPNVAAAVEQPEHSSVKEEILPIAESVEEASSSVKLDEIKNEMLPDKKQDAGFELEQSDFETPIDMGSEPKPQIYILGGDYFSREDFNELKRAEKVEKVGAFVAKGEEGPMISYTTLEPIMKAEDFEAPEFYTETLAGIYAEQGYYEQAIEVYAKLILLYPEKSTYFATRVNEIKLKN